MFAASKTDTITVGEYSVTIRRLSHSQREEAQVARLERTAKAASLFTESDLAELRKAAVTREKGELSPADRRRSLLASYDRDTVLKYGVKSWSAKDKKLPGALAELEEDAAQTIFEAVMGLTIPEETAEESEERAKND